MPIPNDSHGPTELIGTAKPEAGTDGINQLLIQAERELKEAAHRLRTLQVELDRAKETHQLASHFALKLRSMINPEARMTEGKRNSLVEEIIKVLRDANEPMLASSIARELMNRKVSGFDGRNFPVIVSTALRRDPRNLFKRTENGWRLQSDAGSDSNVKS